MAESSRILLGLAILALAGVLVFVIIRVRLLLKNLFGTADLKKLAEEREREAEDTPRTVMGATDLLVPRLQQDFPETSYSTFRNMAEKALREKLQGEGCGAIYIHKTALCEYNRTPGLCEVKLRSAVQYVKDGRKHQDRYAVTFAYVQDADAFGYEKGISFTCPGCGAPIKSLGEKVCAYCGASVEPLVPRAWKLDRIVAE